MLRRTLIFYVLPNQKASYPIIESLHNHRTSQASKKIQCPRKQVVEIRLQTELPQPSLQLIFTWLIRIAFLQPLLQTRLTSHY